ncbi:MAG: quinone-dependent dihydroorotate dehydrogenase [Bacteroidia bacterium]|nr:quinone-dependent dihydroorotate dehydrogenase [Bacteroidia bacterium]
MSWRLLRSLLFALPPEAAHNLIFSVARVLDKAGFWWKKPLPLAPVNLWGLRFPHPIGIAAGLDKNALLLNLWAHLGFAFVEIGTVTPRPQEGNPRPRLFRIPQHQALLNRMGFNNDGAVAIARRLEKRPAGLILGINIGKNRDTPLDKAASDYLSAFRILHPYGDFFVINVSSPNTPGLRTLQTKESLRRIIEPLHASNTPAKPILLKISPDLSPQQVEEIKETATTLPISGIVACNTTTQISYPSLGEGGVSGRPLKPFRTRIFQLLRNFPLPLIASGGIMEPADIGEALHYGAKLVEVYTGFIYQGTSLLKEGIKKIQSCTLALQQCTP